MRASVVTALLSAAVVGGWTGGPVAAAGPPCAELGGAIETGQLCHVHVVNPDYTLDLKFPVDYPDQQALTDYLVQNRDGFVTVAKMRGPYDRPYEMDATIEQHHSGPLGAGSQSGTASPASATGTRSVVLKIFQDVGGPQASTWYKAFNYNLGQRQPITFDTLFAVGSKPLDAIYPIVQRELARQTGLPGVLITPASGLDPGHYQNFAITDDDLIFYFAPGELLPLNAGAISVRVPRNAIPPLVVT